MLPYLGVAVNFRRFLVRKNRFIHFINKKKAKPRKESLTSWHAMGNHKNKATPDTHDTPRVCLAARMQPVEALGCKFGMFGSLDCTDFVARMNLKAIMGLVEEEPLNGHFPRA